MLTSKHRGPNRIDIRQPAAWLLRRRRGGTTAVVDVPLAAAYNRNRDAVGALVRIQGIMDQYKYRDILQTSMLPHGNTNIPPGWMFPHHNDPKDTPRVVKKWFSDNDVDVEGLLAWPTQSWDLYPIENLWERLDREIRQHD
ncbi:hypothetical protein QE152_g23024 [Popillia japonica]|uniref:Uncharacterized protein n=1 Tax=Popillia japonica TaxID=7064 RepID=A0AAW1KK88_POPJA